MSSLNHQHQIYQIPHQPSPQLTAVLDYFDCLKTWDFEKIAKLSAPYYTQRTLPASLSVPPRNKSEDIDNLHTLRDLLKGAPLEVCDHRPFPPRSSELTSLRRLSYTMSMRARAKFGSTYVPSLILFFAQWFVSTLLRALMQMLVTSVNIEGIFNFTFGTGKDENLIVNLTEFVDSKVYAGGDNSGGQDSESTSSNLNGQPEPISLPDSEAHTQVPPT